MSKFIDNLGFMALDKRHSQIYKVSMINLKNGDVYYDLDYFFQTDVKVCPQGASKKDIELLPCTGHKDMNGKSLFKGAIIKFNDELYEVCYNDLNGFMIANTKTWMSAVHADDCSEIVGNIFENDDLKKEVRG